MAQDPYGFPETVQSDPGANAIKAMWAGTGALALGAVAPCCCYFPWLIALPLGGYALYLATQAGGTPGSAEDAAAKAGLVGGGVGVTLGLLWSGLFVFYALYVAVVVAAIAASEL